MSGKASEFRSELKGEQELARLGGLCREVGLGGRGEEQALQAEAETWRGKKAWPSQQTEKALNGFSKGRRGSSLSGPMGSSGTGFRQGK